MARRAGGTTSDRTRVWLAAFGKHPGWNDHIDDLGIETERLVAIKRLLYTAGVSGVIDSGYWESLASERRAEGFDHTIVWRWPESLSVARVWSSRDGKGRSKYPMVVCAQLDGLAMSHALGVVVPRLRQLEAECRGSDSAGAVIALVDSARAELRGRASREPWVSAEPFPPPGSLAELAEHPAVGSEGLVRTLYQLEREFQAFLVPEAEAGKEGTRGRSRTMTIRPQHIRVPRLFSREAEDLALWTRAMLTRIDPAVPLLVAVSGRDWVDVVAGEPGPAQLRFLQAGPVEFPLSTTIPYEIDGAFRERAAERVEASRQGRPVELDPGRSVAGVGAGAASGLVRVAAGAGRGVPAAWVAAAAAGGVVILIVIAVLAMMLAGGNGGGGAGADGVGGEPAGDEVGAGASKAGDEREPGAGVSGRAGSGSGSPGASGSADRPGGEREATETERRFAAWCAVADEWLVGLVTRVDPAAIQQDPHLVAEVWPIVERVKSGGLIVDPLKVPGGAQRTRARLAELTLAGRGPGVLATQEGDRLLGEAEAAAAALGRALSAEAWPAARAAARLRDEAERLGHERARGVMEGLLVGIAGGDGASRAAGVGALASVGGMVRELESDLGALRAIAQRLESSGDAVLAGFGALAEASWSRALGAVGSPLAIGEASAELDRVLGLGSELDRFVQTQWPRVDAAYFSAESGVHREYDGAPSEAVYGRWLAEASDPGYRVLDPSLDPRSSWSAPAFVARARGELSEVERGVSGAMDAALGALETRLSDEAAAIERINAMGWNRGTRAGLMGMVAEADARTRALVLEVESFASQAARTVEEAGARFRARGSISAWGIGTIDAAWRSMRDATMGAAVDPRRALDLASALQSGLTRLDGALGSALRGGGGAGDAARAGGGGVVDGASLARAGAVWRESAAGFAVERAGWDGQRFADLDGAEAWAMAEAGAWAGAVGAYAAGFGAMDASMRSGIGPDEPGSAGEFGTAGELTGLELADRFESELASGGLGVGASGEALAGALRSAFAGPLSLVAGWRGASASGDREALLGAARGAGGEPLATRLAAWRRLGELGGGGGRVGAEPRWPSGAEEVEADARLARDLASLVGAVAGPGVAERLVRELTEETGRRWARAAGSARDFAELGAIAAGRGMADGPEPGELAGHAAFNLGVLGLRERVRGVWGDGGVGAGAGAGGGGGADDEDEAGALGTVVGELAALRGVLAQLEAPGALVAGAWVEELEGLLSDGGVGPGIGPGIDPAAIGPGRAGWTARVEDGGQRLVYTWRSGVGGGSGGGSGGGGGGGGEPGARSLGFRLVPAAEGAGDGAIFMLEHEAPVWLLTEVAREDPSSGVLSRWLDADPGASGDRRVGPRTWAWADVPGQPGRRWPAPAGAWMSAEVASAGEFYPAALEGVVGEATAWHPVTRVSPVAAVLMARMVGCRLPTAGEWSAAVEAWGVDEAPGAGWNVRDAAYAAQRDHVRTRTTVRGEYPDRAALPVEGSGSGVGVGADAAVYPGVNDGVLWFRPVGPANGAASGPTGTELIGNVAELVVGLFESEGALGGLGVLRGDVGQGPLGPVPESAVTLLMGPGVSWGVVGGSALSPPGAGIDGPIELDARLARRAGGFADVGFRLAFSGGGPPSRAIRLRGLLERAPFLRAGGG